MDGAREHPLGLDDDEGWTERLARHAGMPFRSLDPQPGCADPVDHRAAALVGWPTARAFGVIPVELASAALIVALADPFAREPLHVVAELTRREVSPVLATPAAIARALDRVYGPRPAQETTARTGRARGERIDVGGRSEAERLARHAGLAFVALDDVDADVARSVPELVCRHLRLLPIRRDTNRMTIAVADPRDDTAARVVYALTRDIPHVVVAAQSDLDRAYARVFASETEGHTSG